MGKLSTLGLIWAILSATLFASNLIDAYELGNEHTYSIANVLRLADAQTDKNRFEYKITGKLQVGSVWGNADEKILKFKLVDPILNVASLKLSNSVLVTRRNDEFYVHWKLGRISQIYINPSEDVSLRNFKKGIANLFQYQLLDGDYVEDDVAGKCHASYKSHSSTAYTKTKSKCAHPDDFRYSRSGNGPLEVVTKSISESAYDVSPDGTIVKLKSKERFNMQLVLNPKVFVNVYSVFQLKSDGVIGEVEKLVGETIDDALKQFAGIIGTSLLSETEQSCLDKECPKFIDLIKENKDLLADEHLGTVKLASSFLKLVQVARKTSTEDFMRVLNARTVKAYKAQIIDLLGATQTMNSHAAAKHDLKYDTEDASELSEKYFQALAVSTRPNEEIIEDLHQFVSDKSKIKDEKLRDTIIQSISSMCQRLTQLPNYNYETLAVAHVERYLLSGLRDCTESDCKKIYIRGLQNLQSIRTVPILFQQALEGDAPVSVAAMRALKSFPFNTWTAEHKSNFKSIFYQANKKFDSTARTVALDVLLAGRPNQAEIQSLIAYLKSDDKQYEVKQYLVQRLKMLADECPKFATLLHELISNDIHLNNYNGLAQRGLSTALSRTFSKAPGFNVSLISIQEMNGGVLKSGIVDLVLEADGKKFSVFSLGIYAGGLSSYVSGGSSDEAEEKYDDPPTAGMELIVQGSYLRPLQLFRGQGELMAHVWSGTASRDTTAYQATTILHDHEETIRLQNGQSLNINIVGALSIDLSGLVNFSIWSRNAKSEVTKSSAFSIQGKLNLDSSFIAIRDEFTVAQGPELDLDTVLDFSGEVKLCMQLSQPPTVVSHVNRQLIQVPKTTKRIVNQRTRRSTLPGVSHALNQKNNDMCNIIHAES